MNYLNKINYLRSSFKVIIFYKLFKEFPKISAPISVKLFELLL
jgi:hypothetical protein